MNFILFVLVGLFAGWAAGTIIEGHGLGTFGDIIVGIVGAVLGGLIFSFFGVKEPGFWGSVGISVLGAVVLLFVVDIFIRPQSTGKPLT